MRDNAGIRIITSPANLFTWSAMIVLMEYMYGMSNLVNPLTAVSRVVVVAALVEVVVVVTAAAVVVVAVVRSSHSSSSV